MMCELPLPPWLPMDQETGTVRGGMIRHRCPGDEMGRGEAHPSSSSRVAISQPA